MRSVPVTDTLVVDGAHIENRGVDSSCGLEHRVGSRLPAVGLTVVAFPAILPPELENPSPSDALYRGIVVRSDRGRTPVVRAPGSPPSGMEYISANE